MSESVRTRGLPYLTEPEQFVAREVCIGLGPSPRATRSPHEEHGASNGSAPRLRINRLYTRQLNFWERTLIQTTERQTIGRKYNFDTKLIVLYNWN